MDIRLDKYEQLVERVGKEAADALIAQYRSMSPEPRAKVVGWAKVRARIENARDNFTPEGFRDYFWCMYDMELPLHAYYGFIIPIWWAHKAVTREKLGEYYGAAEAAKFRFVYDKIKGADDKSGIIIRASRELAKTIVITLALRSFYIGHHPERMTLLVQVSDESAKDNGTKVAEMIDLHPMWREIFPNIVPEKGGEDKQRRWGANGYFVTANDVSSDEWVRKTVGRLAPTLQSVGVDSSVIIGKHPDGIAIIDDIHNEKNTSSDRELKAVKAKVLADFIYAPAKGAWLVMVGTPWVEGDALDEFAKSNEFVVVDVPAYMEIDPRTLEPQMPQNEWFEEGEYVYLWPEERGADWVRKKKRISTPAEFARMVQLNIEKSLVKELAYQTFPARDIKWMEWPVNFGIDPVNIVKAVSGKEGGSSHFACAFALRSPHNNVVIGDGILEKVDRPTAEQMVVERSKTFRNFRGAAVEMDGGGIAFAATLKSMGILLRPYSTNDIKKAIKWQGTGKANRQYEFLVRLLSYGAVVISDGDTPFLNAARRWLDRFPNFDPRAPEWDVGDSIVMAVFDIPEIWMTVVGNVNMGRESIFTPAPRRRSAWAGAYNA